MIIHIINRQNVRKPNAKKIKAAINFFMNQTAPDRPDANWSEVSLLLTDDTGIRKIKRQFFDVDCVTDVISFSLHPQPVDGKRRTAELVVNVEQAGREGKRRRGFEHEFALYLAHGCDHLAGHDDRTIKERKRMRRRELRWLKMAVKMNLLSGLFGPARRRLS
jgi:rRNA maturation RNase YbeY